MDICQYCIKLNVEKSKQDYLKNMVQVTLRTFQQRQQALKEKNYHMGVAFDKSLCYTT